MTPEQFESGFSSAKHLNEGIHFPKCSAASSCALVKQLKKLSTCLFLVPTSGHKFIYGPSETAVLLLRKSWCTTAKLIRAPGAEQICEAVDTVSCICLPFMLVRVTSAYGLTPTVAFRNQWKIMKILWSAQLIQDRSVLCPQPGEHRMVVAWNKE